ncbi:MAG: hypothetical protein WDN27_00890 [Candidatus Saccharibacteria bacterium]
MAFNSAISTVAPPFTHAAHPQPPITFFTYSATKKIPTNIWWENFLVGTGGQTVSTLPYIQKALAKGIMVTYPIRTVTSTDVLLNPAVKNITLEMSETVMARAIMDYDDLSVQLKYTAAGGNMVINLVRGQAFNSAIYSGVTPVLNTIHALLRRQRRQSWYRNGHQV